jgi:NAD(P)-dependent dehydrogenase (short-subunit alcohol dehydrogenase family)
MTDRPVALVTGASRGIGEATAWMLAARGWRVYATARSTESLSELESSRITPVALDLTDEDSMDEAVSGVLDDAGRIDALVNNAGYAEAGPLTDYGRETIARQFATNVYGPMRLAQLVLPAMRAQGGGRIVNLGTAMARMPLPLLGLYASSKSAFEAFNHALRVETRRFGVRVILVIPGTVNTQFDDVVLERLNENSSNGNGNGNGSGGSPYEPAVERFKELTEGSTERGIAPEDVADKVHHVLTTRWPRSCYALAADGRFVLWVFRRVPPIARDRVMQRVMDV